MKWHMTCCNGMLCYGMLRYAMLIEVIADQSTIAHTHYTVLVVLYTIAHDMQSTGPLLAALTWPRYCYQALGALNIHASTAIPQH
eukprot:scaffold391_cov151-Ochromonas_danica.AAC.3